MSRYKLGDITVNNWNDWDRVPRDPVTIGVMITQGVGYGAAAGVLAAGTLTTGAYLLSAAVGYLAVGAVTSWAYKALAPKPDFGALSSGQSMSNSVDAISPQEFVYGKVRKGGVVTFYETSGPTDAPQKYLHQIIVLAGHEVNSIGNIYINDKVASFSGNFVTTATDGTTTDDWDSKVRIKKHDGSQTTADSDLLSETGVGSTFIGKGIAYLYVRYEFDQDVFTQGVPLITAVVEGKKVYDPTTSSTAYSANAALCIRDFLISSYGLADTAIDDVSFAAARNESNETVTLSGGGTEKRYEINGVVQANRPIGDVLEDMCTACAGTLFWGSGYWKLKVGAYTSPVKTLDMDDLRGPIQLETRLSMRDNFNKVSGTFNDAAQDWVTADYPIVSSSTDAGSFVTSSTYAITELGNTNWNTAAGTTGVTYAVGDVFTAANAGSGTGKASLFLGEDNGQEALLDLSLPFTTSAAMAQRLAKLTLFRGREQMLLTADFGLAALEVEVGDIIGFTNPRYGFSAKQFEVIGWKFSPNGEAGDLRVNLALRETSAAAFNWNAEETAIVSNDTTLPSITSGTNVTALAVNDGGSSVQSDGTVVNSILATWTAATNSFVTAYEVEWGLTSSANRTKFVTDTTSVLLSPVVDGVSYTVRVRSVSISGFRGAYSATTGTSSGDSTAPSAPTSVNATGGIKQITISWVNPTDDDFDQVSVYRASTETGTYSLIGSTRGTSFDDTGLPNTTQKFYKLKASDFSGNISGFSAIDNATTLEEGRSAGFYRFEYNDTTSAVIGLADSVINATNGPYHTASGYTSAVDKDWIIIANQSPAASSYIYNATTSQWDEQNQFVDGDLLVTGTIAGNKIEAGTIDADKLNVTGNLSAISADLGNVNVNEVLTLTGQTSGMVAGKTSLTAYNQDGFFVGKTVNPDSSAGFEFSHTNVNSSNQIEGVIHNDVSGFQIHNPTFKVGGSASGGTTTYTTSQTVNLGSGNTSVTYSIIAGGGAGGYGLDDGTNNNVTGAQGGDTIIKIRTGSSSGTVIHEATATGGTAGANAISARFEATGLAGQSSNGNSGGSGGGMKSAGGNAISHHYGAGGGGGGGDYANSGFFGIGGDSGGAGGDGGNAGQQITATVDTSSYSGSTLYFEMTIGGGGAVNTGGDYDGGSGAGGVVTVSSLLSGLQSYTIDDFPKFLSPIGTPTKVSSGGASTLSAGTYYIGLGSDDAYTIYFTSGVANVEDLWFYGQHKGHLIKAGTSSAEIIYNVYGNNSAVYQSSALSNGFTFASSANDQSTYLHMRCSGNVTIDPQGGNSDRLEYYYIKLQ